MTTRRTQRLFLPMLMLLALAATGCRTMVHVTSEPPGAEVYARGKGRAAYQWDHKGRTPVTYSSYYNKDIVRVRWPDMRFSEPQDAALLGQREASVHFKR